LKRPFTQKDLHPRFLWLSILTGLLWTIHGQLAEGGNANLVTELKSPKSPEQLQANLTTVTAQIQTARLQGKHPDEKKLMALSGALSQVIEKTPEIPEAWQTTAVLIDYRTAPAKPVSSDECGDSPTVIALEGAAPTPSFGLSYKNCTLVLDNAKGILNSKIYANMHNGNDHAPYITIFLENVRVIYNGGALPPVGAISFSNCIFDLQMYVKPPETAQRLIQALLSAPNINNIKVSLSS
jgi:hypothetical protein